MRDPYKDTEPKNRSFELEKHLEKEDKNTGGAPPKYDDPEKLREKIMEYLKFVKEKNLKVTISGLVLYCGFADRASFYDYEKRDGFSHIIKRARTLIQMAYEENLHHGSAGGSIFALKNFGWDDKQITEHQGGQQIIINKNYKGEEKK